MGDYRKCESPHVQWDVPRSECTGRGDWTIGWHNNIRHVCEPVAAMQRGHVEKGGRCMECRQPKHTHWWIEGPDGSV